ncbi:hypothetical protein DYB37_011392 [Aphanomyces astaci]|uniref:Uncharacterized protein n=1 Tax=Aphanomyces astaci TaxID=112090 RepID=A0A3R7B1N7_APHAT|nr:hypothetical protein DYB37_011392 [Aphanomyces astaci]
MEEYALKIQAEKDRRKNVVNRKQAMHRIVDRAQFTKAMQCLKMTPVDVNVLFSVFDFELEHKIEVLR